MAKARNRSAKRKETSKRSKAMTGATQALEAKRKQPKSAKTYGTGKTVVKASWEAIALEHLEVGRHAFVAVAGDV